MAEIILKEGENKVLTRDRVEKIRFIQNIANAQLMLKDLGEKGSTLAPDEIVDLKKHFSKKQIGASQHLDWAIKTKKVVVLDWSQEDNGDIKLTGAKDPANKFKPRGANLPKNVPVEDTKENVFDDGLDDIEDKEDQEDQETRIGGKRKRNKKRRQDEDEEDED